MIRSHRKYNVELRIRDNNGSPSQGVVTRFLYTDKCGQDWVRVEHDWFPVDNRLEDAHAFVHELPRDLFELDEENVQELELLEAA
jgi:hypothetical protein